MDGVLLVLAQHFVDIVIGDDVALSESKLMMRTRCPFEQPKKGGVECDGILLPRGDAAG